jgi:hypothetical protein
MTVKTNVKYGKVSITVCYNETPEKDKVHTRVNSWANLSIERNVIDGVSGQIY